ncbi:MAG: hypothetical protein WBC39_02220 [Phycisphaerae bacterium]
MKRCPWVLAMVLAIARVAAAEGDPNALLREYSTHAVLLEREVRATKDAAKRQRLMDELERVRHQMGPFDSAGTRVHPKAMWHDSAIQSLAEEIRRLEEKPASVFGPARDARLATRRLASACLVLGWRLMDEGPAKYQADAFGQYLANNLKTLDGLFDALGRWSQEQSKLDAGSDRHGVFETNLAKAKEGIAKMGQAAEVFGKLPAGALDAEAMAGTFALYVEGLRAVRQADAALAEDVARRETEGKPPAETNAAEPGAEAGVPESPPMTQAEQARLAEVRAVAGGLEGEAWHEIRRCLERYSDAVANGFAVASARPKAREFLDQIERAALLAKSLREGKGVYPKYLEDRLQALAAALGKMESPLSRTYAYVRIEAQWDFDANRRRIAGGPITPKAAEGLTFALYEYQALLRARPNPETVRRGERLRRQAIRIATVFGQMADWPPKDMKPELRDLYTRQTVTLTREAEEAGQRFAAGNFSLDALAADDSTRDLERLVRTHNVYQRASEFLPSRSKALYAQLTAAAANLVARRDDPVQARVTLDRLLIPLEQIERIEMPEARHERAVTQIAGRTYTTARTLLNREIALGINAACTGDPAVLRQVLVGRSLFTLLWRRAVVLTDRLDRMGVGNLVPFSLPPSVWDPFVARIDQNLKAVLTAYPKLKQSGESAPLRAMDLWDNVYRWAAVAQRLTVDAANEPEPQIDRLIRNLEQAVAASPPSRVWHNWAVGYHATEAATTMLAGFEATADWHRSMIQRYGQYLIGVPLEPRETAG